MADPSVFGHILEGRIEKGPQGFRLRTLGAKGKIEYISVQDLLALYEGKEVRLTLASFENLEKLQRLVESKGPSEVRGVSPEDLPVPFDIRKRNS